LIAGITSIFFAHFADKYDRRGYLIVFVGIWTLAGLIALYVSYAPRSQLSDPETSDPIRG
jgi:MFS family permease